MSEVYLNPKVRHDFVLLFDVTDGNPNGDPDAGNLPRVDPETMHGLVTDVCIKRKVRDYVALARPDQPGYAIYVQHRGILRSLREPAYRELKLKDKGKKQPANEVEQARRWMCEHFYDIRAFGAVMGMSRFNCGQVRGPLQLTFARSIDPIAPLDITITRVAPEDEKEAFRAVEGEQDEARYGAVGRKALVPYGLYRTHGFFNPALAEDTGFSSEDLALFWEALQKMWDLDRSAARGLMACRYLIVFSHQSLLGDAPAHKLFDLVTVRRKDGVETPRAFSDYEIIFDEEKLPEGVTASVLTQ